VYDSNNNNIGTEPVTYDPIHTIQVKNVSLFIYIKIKYMIMQKYKYCKKLKKGDHSVNILYTYIKKNKV